MKPALESLIRTALATACAAVPDPLPEPTLERTRDPRHGDFACPIALALARQTKRKPRDLAEAIVAALPEDPLVERVEIAGPGFINFHLANAAFQDLARQVLEAGEAFGRSQSGQGRRVQVEFVSANPTGPLHVGHGRGAAYGAVVANLLETVGCEVEREYYVNDAGRQMDILALSVWLRYLERISDDAAGRPEFPPNAYQGAYIDDIAADLAGAHAHALRGRSAAMPARPPEADDETWLDLLIAFARESLGEAGYRSLTDAALEAILSDIREDLGEFGVRYDRWFSERSLVDEGALDRAIEQLERGGHTFEDGGALWFRSTAFGDEKDRVLIRDNGQGTYFASDVAYHLNKLERGFTELIDVWGADHHGYVARVRGALGGLGRDPAALTVLLVQFANLYRGGERAAMSTRSGEFVTLRALRDEVGTDAARFFYIERKSDQHLDFDLDLAKSQSNDNPVYYIQYAHARVCSVLGQLAARGLPWSPDDAIAHRGLLVESHELDVLRTISRYPEVVESAAAAYEPHQVAFYLRDLANDFHTYYNAHTFLVENEALRAARVGLAVSVRTVLRSGLDLLGVSAPESM